MELMNIAFPVALILFVTLGLKFLVAWVSGSKGGVAAGWAAAGFNLIIFGGFMVFAQLKAHEAEQQALKCQEEATSNLEVARTQSVLAREQALRAQELAARLQECE